MNRERYVIAELQPDVVEEIEKTEQRLSTQTGFPVTLIAYSPEHAKDKPNRSRS